MKRLIIIVFVLFAAAFANLSCGTQSRVRTRPYPPSSSQMIVDIGFFYDELAPYGRWFQADDYGWAWTPNDVPVGWRPYTDGYWVYTDYGWTWVSQWRWGWAPFHYGRWHFHARHGWIWLPGTVWGPAWVVWRRGPGWIGWAPMPPQSGWRVGLGFEIVREPDRVVEPHWYNFVSDRHFAERDLNRRLELGARNVTLLRETQNVTNYSVADNRVVNRSFTSEPIERVTGRTMPQHRVVDSGAGGQAEQVRGNEVIMYRPNVSPTAPQRSPRNVEPRTQRPSTPAELGRREDIERRELEKEQTRAQQTLEMQHRQVQGRPPTQMPRDQMQKQQEAERRAQGEQRQREQQILRSRQEQRRQVEPTPPAAKREEKGRKPQPTRKPPERRP